MKHKVHKLLPKSPILKKKKKGVPELNPQFTEQTENYSSLINEPKLLSI